MIKISFAKQVKTLFGNLFDRLSTTNKKAKESTELAELLSHPSEPQKIISAEEYLEILTNISKAKSEGEVTKLVKQMLENNADGFKHDLPAMKQFTQGVQEKITEIRKAEAIYIA